VAAADKALLGINAKLVGGSLLGMASMVPRDSAVVAECSKIYA